MTTLIACIGLTFGLCNHYVKETYPTLAECQAALKQFDGRPKVTYVYCRPAEKAGVQ